MAKKSAENGRKPAKGETPKSKAVEVELVQDGRDAKACGCGEHEGEELELVNKALEAIPDDRLIFSATEIFSALADSTRFRILSALSVGELCVSDLLCATNVSQSAVSHQLRFLRDKKLVNVRREGQRSLYSLSDDHVKSLIAVALEHASE